MYTDWIVILLIILLWILHPISLVVSLIIRFRNTVPVLNIDQTNSFKDWNKIRLYGNIAGAIVLFYIIIVLSTGWTFRWYMGLLILQTIIFLVLDRYLIAVNYNTRFLKNNPLLRPRNIKITKFFSYFYIVVRSTYITFCILFVPLIFIVQLGFTIDTILYGIYAHTKKDETIFDRHTPFGIDINFLEKPYTSFSSKSYFNGKLIVWWNNDYSQNTYLFVTQYWIFIKYANPNDKLINYGIAPSDYEYDKENNILYIAPSTRENRSSIKYINNKFYLEYYDEYFGDHSDISDTDRHTVIPRVIEL